MQTHHSKPKNLQAGELSEKLAEEFLRDQGLSFITRNFRCKAGEIDLIMQHGNTLVFVEVRYRANTRYGSAADSITYRKRSKLIRAAGVFLLMRHEHKNTACRFDVIAISDDAKQGIEWHQNAFDTN